MYYEPTVTSRLPFPANQTSHFRGPQTATQIQNEQQIQHDLVPTSLYRTVDRVAEKCSDL